MPACEDRTGVFISPAKQPQCPPRFEVEMDAASMPQRRLCPESAMRDKPTLRRYRGVRWQRRCLSLLRSSGKQRQAVTTLGRLLFARHRRDAGWYLHTRMKLFKLLSRKSRMTSDLAVPETTVS